MADTTYYTMGLDENGEFAIDNYGNLAVFSGAPALAQDTALACSVWKGEPFTNGDVGVDYLTILGEALDQPTLMRVMQDEVLRLPGVIGVVAAIDKLKTDRVVSGKITATTSTESATIAL